MMPSPEDLKGKILVKAKKDPKKSSPKLAECVNYIEAVSFHKEGFDQAEKASKYYHMSSFNESKSFGIFEDEIESKKFVKYNCRQISRIYPDWSRIDSGNMEPMPAWNAGCQMGKCFLVNIYF